MFPSSNVVEVGCNLQLQDEHVMRFIMVHLLMLCVTCVLFVCTNVINVHIFPQKALACVHNGRVMRKSYSSQSLKSLLYVTYYYYLCLKKD